ncbi:hypothetical protein DFH11DRAFT_1828042 [Phellopilus nigrolimitatus]|nr:hypothetical protein DFH11DRAFT_1828042 [Phellopilus nigrolimitatus]
MFSSGKTLLYDTGADERLMRIFINECPAHALSSRSDVLASASLKGHIALWVLNNDWVPGQPILISPGEDNSVKVLKQYCITFGFDEEVSGLYAEVTWMQGAYEIGKHLEATYGKDALAMVVDEGGGFSEQYGGVFAVPAVGEKGYFDTLLEIKSPGGHSSVPPVHTSIGILSALLVEYETHPIPAFLDRTTPFYGMLQCFAAHAPDMDSKLRKTVQQSASSDKALHELEKVIAKDKALRALVSTTQAIDLIQGDVKTNALPEQRGLSSVAATKEHDTKLLVKLAEKFSLTYNAFERTALEPAPSTPTDAAPYKLLLGTIRATYNSHRSFRNTEVQVIPGILTGNTDAQYYWNLTKHIFRYNHENMLRSDGIPGGIHTVNESITVESFLEMIRFFATLIVNVDEYEI